MSNPGKDPIDRSALAQFEDLARQYCRKTLDRMFDGKSPDGDLALLPGILDTAFTIGIATCADRAAAGNEFGVWGASTDQVGAAASTQILTAVAETCAGVAMCLNAQGAASNLLIRAEQPLPWAAKRAALCIQEGPFPPEYSSILTPDAPGAAFPIITEASGETDGYRISGAKSYVYCLPETDTYLVFARLSGRLGCFAISAGASGLTAEEVGARTGLRACSLRRLQLNEVRVGRRCLIDDGERAGFVFRALGLFWIGMAAIAAGIARGSVQAARQYMAQRRQGGLIIENHPALKQLLAGAQAKADAAIGLLTDSDTTRFDTPLFLKKAATAKLMATTLGSEAVTDCLQVFGGYGYMEDFGMEKRLRDITVLKSAHGSPFFLKQFIFDIGKGF